MKVYVAFEDDMGLGNDFLGVFWDLESLLEKYPDAHPENPDKYSRFVYCVFEKE